jgi:hypothetical protein
MMSSNCKNHQKVIGFDDAPVLPGRETATHENDLQTPGGGENACEKHAFGRCIVGSRAGSSRSRVDRSGSATPFTSKKEVGGLTVMVAHPPLVLVPASSLGEAKQILEDTTGLGSYVP